MNIKSYIRGNRHGKKANNLERKAMNDPFLQDAIDGFDSVPGDHVETIEKLEKLLAPQPKRIDKRVWMWAAAAVLVLLIGIPFLLRQSNTEDIQVASSENIDQKETTVLSPEKDTVLVADHTLPKQKEGKTAAIVPKEIAVQEIEVSTSVTIERTDEVMEEEATYPRQSEKAITTIKPKQVPAGRVAQLQKENIESRVAGTATASNTKIISGKIVDETGEPIIGATINIKNTRIGTATDTAGNFQLTVPENEKEVLTASYIGMENVEIPLKENVGNITMKADTELLSEVVVAGYGTQRKTSTAGTVSKVKEAVPTFGEIEFKKYFKENYDKTICANEPISIKVDFYVNAQGQLGNIVIKENSCPDLETEIKRLLLGSPNWSQRNRKITLNLKLNE